MLVHTSVLTALLVWASTGLAGRILDKRASPASEEEFNELQRAAKLSSAAYVSCYPTAFDINVTYEIDNAETDTQGYVGFSESLQRIAVVMRGSTSAKDFENDANINLTYPVLSGVDFPPDVLVTEGVYGPWASVHDEVIDEVARLIALYPDYSLESAGHSLGGALTYWSYIALAQNFPDKNITSNALAAFTVGNQAFADFGTSQNGLLRRGNNLDDGIPNQYPQFVHYGVEFYTAGTVGTTVVCEGELDPDCTAGNGKTGITLGHLFSYGVAVVGGAGCSDLLG